MNQQAEFKTDGTGGVEVVWDEAAGKPVDTSKLQGAMFMDRADLWKKHSKRTQPVRPENVAGAMEV